MCSNEQNIITQSDFACIGQVAKHCDMEKLCIGIAQAQEFDISELFCDLWEYILTTNEEVEQYDAEYAAYLIQLAECEADPDCTTPPVAPVEPENYGLNKSLICGGEYQSCNDKTRKHSGVKKILVYYSYARYIMLNGYNDTATGTKTKTSEFSIPTPLKEVERIADNYRSMGYKLYKDTLAFLCNNKDSFADFNSKDCIGCGCGNNCDNKTKAKGYGFKSSVISKNIHHNNNGILNHLKNRNVDM